MKVAISEDMIELIAHRLKMLWAWCLSSGNWNGITWCRWPWKGVQLSVFFLATWTGRPFNRQRKDRKALHIPFFIDNDANVVARTLKGLRNQPDVVFMTLGSRCRRWYRHEGQFPARCTWSRWWAWSHHCWLWWFNPMYPGKKGCLETLYLLLQLVSSTLTCRYADEYEGPPHRKLLSTTEKK